uniref:Anaphase-promoting complex subunit 4 n=1 Tax=Kalmanozyma brasiliensis (strain GHG001) TaxID=1365824 RepID=V5EXC2_KALBG
MATSVHQLRLPLPFNTRYGPLDSRRKVAAISRTSHLLRFYLGYALDAASASQQVYQHELLQKVTTEWTKNIDDLSLKFGGDMRYELINVLLTGRAGPAAEQFLLGNLTEGVLTRLEKQSHTATYALKRLISDSLRPALERCIVCMTGLLGQVRFLGESDGKLRAALRILHAALDSTLSLAKEVDLEALFSQEFYRWCRTERERQERIKQDQDEPRLPITYDVHYVASYIDRGFKNEQIHARMGNDLPAEASQEPVA